MPEPTTPLPPAKAAAEDERSVLLGYLQYHRTVLVRKAEGLTDEQARTPACPPSSLTLLGLIRHVTDAERHWFRRRLVAEELPDMYGLCAEDLEPPPDATLAGALAAYRAEVAVSDENLGRVEMGDFAQGGPESGQHTVRRTVVHMIEEYARHCGHADLLREAIDGATGD